MLNTKIKGLLLDLSGTIYVDDAPVEGALETIRILDAAKIKILYLTNTSNRPLSRILNRLTKMGFNIPENEVFTAPIAARRILEQAGHKRCHFLLNHPVLEDLPNFEAVKKDPDAVVVGDIGEGFDYKSLTRAFNMLMEGAAFYALAADRYFEGSRGLKLDVGPFVAALEYATGRKSILVGKPAPEFFEAAAKTLGVEPAAIAAVGDDIESDIGGAIKAGMRGVLVETGKYRKEVADLSGVTPHMILNSIADLPHELGLA